MTYRNENSKYDGMECRVLRDVSESVSMVEFRIYPKVIHTNVKTSDLVSEKHRPRTSDLASEQNHPCTQMTFWGTR